MADFGIEKPEKTPEELAEIAYLDKLRTCVGEEMPIDLPLACVVKVVGYEEVPKAGEQYAREEKIDAALLAEIGSPMIPEDIYARMANGEG